MRKRETTTAAGIPLRFDGMWPNGLGNWTILSGGPGRFASFSVRPGEDLGTRARETLHRFLEHPCGRGDGAPAR